MSSRTTTLRRTKSSKCIKLPFGEFKGELRAMEYLNTSTVKSYVMFEKFIVSHCL